MSPGNTAVPACAARARARLAWPAVSGSLPAFLARRLALLLLTLVLVPSLSFLMFTLIQGEHTSPLDLRGELASYLAAVFLQGDVGGERRSAPTRSSARAARSRSSRTASSSTSTCWSARSVRGAGRARGRHGAGDAPALGVSRAITVLTALALASPVYFVGLALLILFAPGSGAVAEVPFLSAIAGYRAPRPTSAPSCTASGCRA